MKGEATLFEPPRAALEQGFATATAADVVLAAEQYLRLGSSGAAAALCRMARRRGLDEPAVALAEATGRFAMGEHVTALELVNAVLSAAPAHLGALSLKAHMMAALGRPDEGRALIERVISTYADYPGALALLSSLVFPGPSYRDTLARLHRLLAPDTYLEIGVDTGQTLALAVTASLAVGVDPEAIAADRPMPNNARFYCLRSDEFFARETPASALGGKKVDLTFIDGMHLFEYALRDFANAERWSNPESTIVIHDCIPVAAVAARRERQSNFWVGDVWKVLEALYDNRSDLDISLVPAPPSGLVIVRGLDPDSTVLTDDYDDIVACHRDREYPYGAGAWPERYRFVENSEHGIGAALARQ